MHGNDAEAHRVGVRRAAVSCARIRLPRSDEDESSWLSHVQFKLRVKQPLPCVCVYVCVCVCVCARARARATGFRV